MPRDTLAFVLMRGGTSKGVFLRAEDVPMERPKLTALLLDLFGSPDRRQIDGIGGADKLTSKAAIIGAPTRPDTDVDYLFGQVGTVSPEVDYNLNCGNLTAAVGVYAIEEGYVPAVEGTTVVRVHMVNTDRVVRVEIPVWQGKPVTQGDERIGGVPGTGAPISLDFAQALGSITGRLLPTGNVLDVLDVPGVGPVEVSILDGPNLAVYVHHSTLKMSGIESPDEIDSNDELKSRMDAIRKVVAYRCGLREYWDSRQAPSTPMLIVVSGPQSYRTCTQGDLIEAERLDLVVRQFASGSASKTLAGTLTATTGVACRMPGTIPHKLLAIERSSGDGTTLTFGHPSGSINVQADLDPDGSGVRRLAIVRTARRLAEGRAFLKKSF